MNEPLSIEIRQAGRKDLRRVEVLLATVWRELASPERDLELRFRRFPEGFRVAWAGVEPVGFCSASRVSTVSTAETIDESFPAEHDPAGGFLAIHSLSVSPVFRRRRVGERLVLAQLSLAKNAGCHKAQAVANALSVGLFERLGFFRSFSLPHLYPGYARLMPQPVFVEKVL